MRGIRCLVHGFVRLEQSDGFPRALDLDRTFREVVRVYLSGIERGETNPNDAEENAR